MNDRLNMQDLTDELAESHGMSRRNAESFVRDFFVLIAEALERDKYVKIKGFGTFKLIEVDTRESVDVNTGEHIEIQGHNRVSFTPDPTLKDAVNKPFSAFETVVLDSPAAEEPAPDEASTEEAAETDDETSSVEEPNPQEETDESTGLDNESHGVEESNPQEETEKTAEPQAPAATNQPSTGVAELMLSDKKKREIARKAESSSVPILAILAMIVILGCIGFVAYLYYPDFTSGKEDTQEQQIENTESADNGEAAVGQAGAEAAKAGAVETKEAAAQPAAADTTAAAAQPKQEPVVKEAISVQRLTAGTSYKPNGVLATYTVKRGESLSDIAAHFYGGRSFYTYIVDYNKSKIKNPDSVPVGTELQIPRLVSK